MQKAHEAGRICFVGNVEANQIFTGEVDVLVTDGFTGNVLLKGVEGTLKYMLKLLKGMFYKNAKNKVAGLLIKSEFGDLKAQLDPSEVGGTALLGISKPVIDARAFCSAIRQAVAFAESGIIASITENIDNMRLDGAEEEG